MTELFMASTQPVFDSQEDECSPVDYEHSWGKFYPQKANIGLPISLTQDSFTVGRYNGCDYTLTKEEVGEKYYDCISSYHFRVERKEEQEGFFVTLITDLSSNGTYLNGLLIGKNRTAVLSHHDNIGISKSTNNVFSFYDASAQVFPYPDEITKNYAICNILGKGGYGEVRLVMKKQTSEKFALKSIDMRPVDDKRVIDSINEIKVLRKLHHDNIVKLVNGILNQEDNSLYIFLEYMPGGDMSTFLRDRQVLSESVTKFMFYQILQGVEYLHHNRVLHRDLKPANILLSAKTDYPKVKITDFGLSKMIDGGNPEVHTRCGTLSFAAPELQFPNISKTYDFRADIWSLGVILYLCLSGILPFRRDRKDIPLERQIQKANYSFPADKWGKISMRPKLMIKTMCLLVQPSKRCFIDKLIDDDWFKNDDSLQRRILELSSDSVMAFDKENSVEPPAKRRCV